MKGVPLKVNSRATPYKWVAFFYGVTKLTADAMEGPHSGWRQPLLLGMGISMNRLIICVAALALASCATASNVQEMADGSFMISARAAPIRGGTTGAQDVAYTDAQEFCAGRGQRAVVVNNQERDVYQGSFSGGSGGVFAAGNVNLNFRCE